MISTKPFVCAATASELAEEMIKDIRQLYLQNQIREDGQIKRNPRYFTPWSARNSKYNKQDKAIMLKLVPHIAYLNNKNIWQFKYTDLRIIGSILREEANKLDNNI